MSSGSKCEPTRKLRAVEILRIAPSFSVDEAALMTGVGRTMLYEQIKVGNLRLRKCGASSIILRGDLEAWLNGLPIK